MATTEVPIKAEWLKPDEAAAVVQVSRTTIWRWAKSDFIRTAKIAGTLRVSRTSLLKFMDESATGGRE